MNLLRTYSKIMIVRNHLNYLRVIWSIIVAYFMIAFSTIYIGNIMELNSVYEFSNLHYTCISILSILLIAGITLVIHQIFNIMKSSMRDYNILRGLGATKYNIRILNIFQALFLTIISIPIGLLCGYLLTSLIIGFMDNLVQNKSVLERLLSEATLLKISGIIGSFIIVIGIYHDRYIRKMPLSNILSDRYVISEEV